MPDLCSSSLLVATALGAGACGSAGDAAPSGPEPQAVVYQVVTGSSSSSVPDATHTAVVLHLVVTRSNGAGGAGATVRLQATTGSISTNPVLADANGGADVTWTLPLPLPAAYTLSACATDPADAPCTYKAVWEVP